MAPGHDGRRLVERGEVGRPGMAVGDENVAKAAARQRPSVVDDGVAHNPLADAHGAHRLEGEGAEVQGGSEHDGPSGSGRHQAVRDQLREVPRGEGVHPQGQVRPVLLQRAHGEDHQGARAVQRVEAGHRHFFEPVHAHEVLLLLAAM